MSLPAFTVAAALCVIAFAASCADASGQDKPASPQPTPPRNLDTHHRFAPPSDLKTWQARRVALRRRILVSAGLWPLPRKAPLRPRITGKIDCGDFTIENVALETLPGFYLCGNLYRPNGKHGPFPGIVNPHGHWEHGRLEMQPDVPKAAPPPAPMGDGKGNLVAIGANLARQGHVVFAYDMVGYNDTNQVSHQFAGSLRPWLWGVSLMGLQLWNSIRVIDYLQSLPDVDPKRIGVTGASGGGTQTFLLGAVDDRVACSVPVNMVSAHMQGGCLCENGPGLRVGTDNVEIASLVAPKPQLLIAATGDWTKNVPHEEWPALKKVYDLYGAGDKTACVQFNYQHNYNIESREAMYAWFGRWLLNDPNPEHFREKPFDIDTQKMRVWTDQNPMPSDALKEPELIQALIDRSKKRVESMLPRDSKSLAKFRETMAPALADSLAVTFPIAPAALPSRGDTVTIVLACQGEDKGPKSVVIGPRSLALSYELPPITASADSLWSAFFSTYNRTPLGDRVEAIAGVLAGAAGRYRRVNLIGVGQAGPWALLMRALVPAHGKTIVDAAGLNSSDDQVFLERLYAPGLRGIGDLTMAATLVAPESLCIYNASGLNTDDITAVFRAVQAPLKIESGPMTDAQIAAWLAER